MSTRTVKWALVALVAANVLVGVAWWAKDYLVKAGFLAEPPGSPVPLGKRSLPPVAIVEPEDDTAATVDGEAASVDHVVSPPTPEPLPAAAPPPTPEPASTCIVAGPFKDKPAAEALAARLEETGGSVRVDTEVIVAQVYLVYVVPATRQAALGTREKLKAQGVDAYVIPSGARKNGVSVGLFSVQELALAQRDRVAEMGYSVQMQSLPRTSQSYRVVGRDVLAQGLADVVAMPCEGVDPR